jgi:hypothetical protein
MAAGVPTASLYAGGGGAGDGMGVGAVGCSGVTEAGAVGSSNCTPSNRLTSSSSPSTGVRQCTPRRSYPSVIGPTCCGRLPDDACPHTHRTVRQAGREGVEEHARSSGARVSSASAITKV